MPCTAASREASGLSDRNLRATQRSVRPPADNVGERGAAIDPEIPGIPVRHATYRHQTARVASGKGRRFGRLPTSRSDDRSTSSQSLAGDRSIVGCTPETNLAMTGGRVSPCDGTVPRDKLVGRIIKDVIATSNDALPRYCQVLAAIVSSIWILPVKRTRPFKQAAGHVEQPFRGCAFWPAADRHGGSTWQPNNGEFRCRHRIAPGEWSRLRASSGSLPFHLTRQPRASPQAICQCSGPRGFGHGVIVVAGVRDEAAASNSDARILVIEINDRVGRGANSRTRGTARDRVGRCWRK